MRGALPRSSTKHCDHRPKVRTPAFQVGNAGFESRWSYHAPIVYLDQDTTLSRWRPGIVAP